MKGLAFIISILILFLSLKPCSDGNNTEDKLADEISDNHNHQDDSDDSCTLICICSCCGIYITYVPVKHFSIKKNPEISTVDFSKYQSNYRFDFLSSIWQPPRLIS